MACGGFFTGTGGQSFKLKVTKDNDETMMIGSLTELNRATEAFRSQTFTRAQLRAGISVLLKAGHSYHLEILKAPAAGNVNLDIVKPNGKAVQNTCTGRILGPWIIRVA
jgi:hypothetical protein